MTCTREHLTAALESNTNHWHSVYRPQIAALEDLVSDLQIKLDNAPHDADCAQETYDGHDDAIKCTCWKARTP